VRRTSDFSSRAVLTIMSLDVPPKNLTSILASTRGCSREMAISKSPTSTKFVGRELAKLKAKIPGLYPPEYKNNAICLVGLFNAQSLSYPPAYLSDQTPFNNGDDVGLDVGFMDSNLSKASLTLARVSLLVSSEPPGGRSSRMEVMMDSEGVGSTVSDSTSIISSVLESDGKSSAMSDM